MELETGPCSCRRVARKQVHEVEDDWLVTCPRRHKPVNNKFCGLSPTSRTNVKNVEQHLDILIDSSQIFYKSLR